MTLKHFCNKPHWFNKPYDPFNEMKKKSFPTLFIMVERQRFYKMQDGFMV